MFCAEVPDFIYISFYQIHKANIIKLAKASKMAFFKVTHNAGS